MRMAFITGSLFLGLALHAQDNTATNIDSSTTIPVTGQTSKESPAYTWIFASPKLISSNTVETVPRGQLEFKVTHNFGDIAGDNGGIKQFFGLDNAADVRIGFQYGFSRRLNVLAARAKGASGVLQQYELGLKYRILQQAENDPSHPLSMTLFASGTVSAMKASPLDNEQSSFHSLSDRMTQTVQLLMARRFGKVSFQLSPEMVHRNYVVSNDDNTLFALGAALRLPIGGVFSLIADYTHAFHSQESIDYWKTKDVKFYGALGAGIEIVTEGHVFQLNFTNATDILENRYISHTTTSWHKGQVRWGFTIARDFKLPRHSRQK